MVIESIELTNFRNFESRKLVFHNRNCFLVGQNGSGKSNLLESIAFSSILRSFRGASPREMIRIGSKGFQIRTVLRKSSCREELTIREHFSGRRELFIGKSAVRRSSDFIREFHSVVFAPEDREIVSGSSGYRRKFFDILISEIEPEYLLRLNRYHRALSQRNKALKFAPATAAAFEEELAEQAPFISAARKKYTALIAENMAFLLGNSGEFEIVYRSASAETPEEHRKLFAVRRESELHRQCTLSGPQLDEFEMFFNRKLLRTYGSTGQIRLISLLLKLSQFKLVKNNSPLPTVVLADDVTGELDENNLQLFLDTIADARHAFFTCAEPPRFTLPDSERVDFSPSADGSRQ